MAALALAGEGLDLCLSFFPCVCPASRWRCGPLGPWAAVCWLGGWG